MHFGNHGLTARIQIVLAECRSVWSLPLAVLFQERKTHLEFVRTIQRPFLRQVSPTSLLDVSADNCQKALVDESGIIRNHMGTYNR
jgi:hypothetical protein